MNKVLLDWIEEWLVTCLDVDIKNTNYSPEVKAMYESLNNLILTKFIKLYKASKVDSLSIKFKPENAKKLFDVFQNPKEEYKRLLEKSLDTQGFEAFENYLKVDTYHDDFKELIANN